MPRRLVLIEDDLMFAQRVRTAAGRLNVNVEGITAAEARRRPWSENDVVVLQGTLRPEQQLALADYLARCAPAPIVVAVTGHLETGLRERFKASGARLAAHSAMDRVLERALSDGDAPGDAADHRRQRPQP